jgi:hypothetical protein
MGFRREVSADSFIPTTSGFASGTFGHGLAEHVGIECLRRHARNVVDAGPIMPDESEKASLAPIAKARCSRGEIGGRGPGPRETTGAWPEAHADTIAVATLLMLSIE